jgi:uncharacterized protein
MARKPRSGRRSAGRRAPARSVHTAGRPPDTDEQRAVALADRPVVGYQRWHEILFLHWGVSPAALRPLVDPRLELDLLDGRAYVSATPFTLRGGRLRFLPHLPFVSEFLELNLRTYVRARGVPGLWFFSLDAASAPACAIARASLGLPYFRARMARSSSGGVHRFESERVAPASRAASFRVRWSAGEAVAAPPGTLDHFVAERYALYSTLAGRLVRVRVRHPAWSLREAEVDGLDETLFRAAGLPAPGQPLLARCSRGVNVSVLAPEVLAPPAFS